MNTKAEIAAAAALLLVVGCSQNDQMSTEKEQTNVPSAFNAMQESLKPPELPLAATPGLVSTNTNTPAPLAASPALVTRVEPPPEPPTNGLSAASAATRDDPPPEPPTNSLSAVPPANSFAGEKP